MPKLRSALVLGLAVAGLCSIASADTKECSERPKFSDYPAGAAFHGSPAPIDVTSHPAARRFRTVLREGAKHGPNFAGHLTVVVWGCGSSCESFAVVDAITGRVFTPPRAIAEAGVEFRLDSALLVVNPPERLEAETPRSAVRLADAQFYVWDNGRFTLLCRIAPTRPK